MQPHHGSSFHPQHSSEIFVIGLLWFLSSFLAFFDSSIVHNDTSTIHNKLVQIPLVVALNNLIVWVIVSFREKITSYTQRSNDSIEQFTVNNNKVLDDENIIREELHDEHSTVVHLNLEKQCATEVDAITHLKHPSQILDINEEDETVFSEMHTNKLVVCHLLHQYLSFEILFWIGIMNNSISVLSIRNLEPSLLFLLFSKHPKAKTDVVVQAFSAMSIVFIQFWTNSSSITKLITILLNSALLGYRNLLWRKFYTATQRETSNGIYRTISLYSGIIMVVVYVIFLRIIDVTDWNWQWIVISSVGGGIFLAADVILLRFWDIPFHSSFSLINRTLMAVVLCIFSWCAVQYSETLHMCMGVLGTASAVYILFVHSFSITKRMILAIVALSFITFAVTSHFLNLYGSFLDTASSTIHTRSESILLRAERPPLRVAIFTAAGNGNLGDNLQIHSWTSHFNAWNMRKYGGRRKIDIYSLSGEFCCYPFDDRRKLVVDSLESLTQFLSKYQPHYTIIGGGGIFGHPHRPFDTRNVTWSQVVAQFPNVKWIIASVGAGEDISEDLTARVSSLIDHAKVVTGRDGPSQQMLQKHISDKNRRVTLLPDPVLVDEEHFPFPPISNDFEHESASSKQTCWILRKPLTEELVSLMKPHINLEKDLLLAMEEQDKVLDNIFHRKHISVFPTGGQWLWDNLQKHCAYVVTMRFHGAILAFRSQIPTLAIEPLSRKIIQLYQDVYGNTDCVMTHINEKELSEKFHKCRSINPSPIVPVLKEMRKQFDQFMDTTFD